jgi:glutaredoxin 3
MSPAAATQATRSTHRVLVFTTPSCPWCRRAKSYLRDRRVPFREIDVSRDEAAARDLIRRSGQMGVFDRQRIDRMLGLHG